MHVNQSIDSTDAAFIVSILFQIFYCIWYWSCISIWAIIGDAGESMSLVNDWILFFKYIYVDNPQYDGEDDQLMISPQCTAYHYFDWSDCLDGEVAASFVRCVVLEWWTKALSRMLWKVGHNDLGEINETRTQFMTGQGRERLSLENAQ